MSAVKGDREAASVRSTLVRIIIASAIFSTGGSLPYSTSIVMLFHILETSILFLGIQSLMQEKE